MMLSALLLMACETCPTSIEYILPDDLPAPEIVGDKNHDLVTYAIQDIKWRLLVTDIRYIVGDINESVYRQKTNYLMKLLNDLE